VGGIAEWPLAGLGVHAGHEATGLPRYSRLRPSWPGLEYIEDTIQSRLEERSYGEEQEWPEGLTAENS